ncbi:Heterokaryon incompatibility Het-C [Penicillium taxi]|uniref:Heterokaryon incompatibility Het-C n=1 Tax=Penicillium taxi TaxID=168475 RepID=UPI002544FE42|nr:Heterokaryon incompatibility Het-C [Penicillium taxi]KAJ5893737.1 Heterokaryon incompatibility Het-C [Penicillium taxi]
MSFIRASPVLLVCLLFLLPQVHAFGAGNIASISAVEGQNWRHGDIEDMLKNIAFIAGHKWTSTQIKRVYFGNWLRDYSQAMDVGTLKSLQAETIRILVWVLSFLNFGYATGEFEVTSERLGVYRPEEHIDNPKDYADNLDARQYDSRLRPPVRQIELDIDHETGMKNYIANEKGDWATSSAYVKFSLCRSIHYGRMYLHGGERKGNEEDLCEALRCLGQGLHTLEDFAAHTNYCELVLRELGFHNVFPTHRNCHTNQLLGEATDHFTQSEVNEMDIALGNAENNSHSSNPLGALTGLLGKIPGTRELVSEAEHLKQTSEVQETANRSRGSHMGYARGFEQDRAEPSSTRPGTGLQGMPDFNPQETVAKIYPILAFRDKVVRKLNSIIEKIPGLEAIMEKISETLTVFIMSLLAPFIRPLISAASKSLQTGSAGVIDASGKHQYEPWTDPHCTDPTHSMLSKDHFANILNEPAGRVASSILQYVAPRVLYAWQHIEVSEHEVMNDCMHVFHNPAVRNMHNEVHRNMFEAVEKWAHARPDHGHSFNDVLSAEGVRAGRNTGGVPHTHGGGQGGFAALGGGAHGHQGQGHSQSQSHGLGSFFSGGQQQNHSSQSHHSSGMPWDNLSSLPIPGINRLESTINSFIPGGLLHGSSREVDESEGRTGNDGYEQGHHHSHSHDQTGHGRYQY